MHGMCKAVSDGSYKDSLGTAAWMIQDMVSKQVLSGTSIIPGHTSDQSAYQSELGGIFSIVATIHNICNYYNISKGMIQIACDGLGPLTQCFAKYQNPSPSTAHFDLIMSIQNMIDKTPIDWHWHHVLGHQDETSSKLDLKTINWINVLSLRVDVSIPQTHTSTQTGYTKQMDGGTLHVKDSQQFVM